MVEEAATRPRAGARVALALGCLLPVLLLIPYGEGPPRWTLALTGDVMLGRGVAQALEGKWESAFEQVRGLGLEADLGFGNLESPLTAAACASPIASWLPEAAADLSARPESVAALEAFGFSLLSLANNHSMDCGPDGLLETAANLRTASITPLLAGDPVCLSAPTKSCWLALDDSTGQLAEEEAAAAVALLAEDGVLVAVSLHWGGEYQAEPSPRQQALAHALAEAGAGLIVGHGPHVLQRVEWLGSTLVLYSLGNTLFDQPYPADTRRGAIFLVSVERGAVVSVAAVPILSGQGRVRVAGSSDVEAALSRLGLGADGRMQRPSP
jgi:poly-gamma-glutamate capsule biosynthesis protein CapA/YwtB (metallophosphatase superfamily)